MSKRHLASFCSPVAKAPSFVIPVFHVPGSNQSCVQDLNGSGNVSRWLSFDPASFFPVPVIPPSTSIDIGEPGILAFWLSDDCVFTGTRDDLRAHLSTLDESSLPAFVAVEALSLVGDKERLMLATERAAERFSAESARVVYRARIANRISVLNSLAVENSAPKSLEERELDLTLELLQKPINNAEWYTTWIKAWRHFDYDDRLFGIARWRIENFDSQDIEARVLYDLASPYDPYRSEYVISFLERSNTTYSLWPSIWLRMQRYPLPAERFERLGVKLLENHVKQSRSISYTWMTVWRRLWSVGEHYEKELIVIAEAGKNLSHQRDHFIETIALRLVNERHIEWAITYVLRWLESPRPFVIWVSAYIQLWEKFSSEQYIEAGVTWLRQYGKGMNVWMRLWEHLRPHISTDLARELGENWLLRARKDLSSWPAVFGELASTTAPSVGIMLAARAWKAESKPGKRNRLIEHIADLAAGR